MRVGTSLPIALALILTSVIAAPAADRGDDRSLLLSVTVDTVRKSRIDDVIVGTGTVAAWREMPISSEANGLAIVELSADEGDEVEKGQVLARLNQSVLLAQIEQNKAAVAEAEASLANALSDQKRAHTVTSGVISQQTIEQRETLVKTTTAKLASARAILEETKARLAQTEIVAPANAIVATRTATLGQVVQTGTELFRLIQDGRIEVNALVPEADIFKIFPQQSARIVDPMGRTFRRDLFRGHREARTRSLRGGRPRTPVRKCGGCRPRLFANERDRGGGDRASFQLRFSQHGFVVEPSNACG